MLRSMAMRATLVGMGANLALLALKATATSLSDSLTIFSEMLNSLADLVAAFAVLLCVRWAWQTPDEGHPFGHRRAEPPQADEQHPGAEQSLLAFGAERGQQDLAAVAKQLLVIHGRILTQTHLEPPWCFPGAAFMSLEKVRKI